MTCRYKNERLKEKRSRKYPKYQEDMIKSKTNPKDIKNIKKEDF